MQPRIYRKTDLRTTCLCGSTCRCTWPPHGGPGAFGCRNPPLITPSLPSPRGGLSDSWGILPPLTTIGGIKPSTIIGDPLSHRERRMEKHLYCHPIYHMCFLFTGGQVYNISHSNVLNWIIEDMHLINWVQLPVSTIHNLQFLAFWHISVSIYSMGLFVGSWFPMVFQRLVCIQHQ